MTDIVKAPLVVAKAQEGHDVYLYEGVEVPSNITAECVKHLRDSGMIGKGPDPVPASTPSDVSGQDSDLAALSDEELVKKGQEKILDTVGDDAERAARLLALENSKGDKARPKLVAGLQEAIDAANSGDDSSGGDD